MWFDVSSVARLSCDVQCCALPCVAYEVPAFAYDHAREYFCEPNACNEEECPPHHDFVAPLCFGICQVVPVVTIRVAQHKVAW